MVLPTDHERHTPEGDGTTRTSPRSSRAKRARAEATRRAKLAGTAPDQVDADAAVLDRQLTEMEAAYEAWTHGEQHPDDPIFLAIWRGETKGMSEAKARTVIAERQQLADEVRTGRKRPEDMGPIFGNTAEMILANLQRSIDMFDEALRCQGRNLSINQTRVHKLKLENRR